MAGAEKIGKAHSCRENKTLIVTEQLGKVHRDRAVRESTQRQSSQGKYTETEQSGKVQSDGAVRKVHNDSTVRE